MPQFSEEWLDKLKSSTDIVEIIGEKVQLKQSGQNYTGLCPFHDEKTPSFSVNTQNQFYYCFGCGSGGNVFNFVMQTENVSFPDAVIRLANRQGLEIPNWSSSEKEAAERRELLCNLNHLAAQYFYKVLRSNAGAAGREYLLSRGIDGKLARHFYLGYATPGWDGLTKYLQSEGIELELAEQAGLVIKGKKGFYDRFRNRVIFPICDHQGRFLGFGGRHILQERPKYLNTPESPVFNKGKLLYGINWAKQSVKDNDSVVIVEGYTDCIGLYSKGITNVVASLGTAFTDSHAKLVGRFTENVTIAFDGDAAGEKATLRGLALLRQSGLKVKVASLEQDDPDTFARSHSKGEVLEWINNALPFMDYQITRIVSSHDVETREGKLGAARDIIDILKQVDNVIERQEYTGYASRLLGLDPQVMTQELARLAGSNRKERVNASNSSNFSHIMAKNRYTNKDLPIRPGNTAIEKQILRWLLARPTLIDDLLDNDIDVDTFADNDCRHLFYLLKRGTWDRHGEAVAENLFSLEEPTGRWEEYLQYFRVTIWVRQLVKIEENLASMENLGSSEVRKELAELLQQYYGIRKAIFLAQRKAK